MDARLFELAIEDLATTIDLARPGRLSSEGEPTTLPDGSIELWSSEFLTPENEEICRTFLLSTFRIKPTSKQADGRKQQRYILPADIADTIRRMAAGFDPTRRPIDPHASSNAALPAPVP